MILAAENQNRIHGLQICRQAPIISHLFFADDSLIFFKASDVECHELNVILSNYERASGQSINKDKSSVSFSNNVPLQQQESLAQILTITRVDKHDKYLGLPMEISYSKLDAFGYLKDKFEKKLNGWREKFLSSAGKEVLIKSVIQSIPTYVMSCFELPKGLCHDLHQIMAKFWWGSRGTEKKIHWESWDKLCSPKSAGGMGFRNLTSFNISLLAKQGWRLLSCPNSLAARVFKARYHPQTHFMKATTLPDMSYSWRSILAGRELLSKGLRYQIYNGTNVSI